MMNLLFVLAGLAPALSSAAPLTWTIESEKTLYWAPEPVLEVSVQALEADDDYWDRIDLSLHYDVNGFAATADELKRTHPGYRLARVLLNRESDYQVEIPAIGLNERETTYQSGEGPAFDRTIYVAKKDSRTLRAAARDLSSLVRVTGSLRAHAPREVLSERAEIAADTCRDLLGGEGNVHGLLLAYPTLDEKIAAVARTEENRRSLHEQVLAGCFEVGENRRISSFADLLRVPLRTKNTGGSFVAELWKREFTDELRPLTYSLRKGD